MWNSQSKEQPQMWSTHDLACAHCRARKIRCGRERPQCESCKRDGVECRYSSPGKRINHVKLLCQNFEALEDQLNNIQGDLSALTTLVKNGGSEKPLPIPGEFLSLEKLEEQTSKIPRKDRHIVRNETHAIDRYHGPSSLYALCREFYNDPTFQTSDNLNPTEDKITIRMLLEKMCADACSEEHMDIPSAPATICLPPRQFLNIVIGPFFQNADYATDIFVQSNFHAQLDRVYSRPLGPADEAWAICFNVIVLLAIGKDQSSHNNSPFIQPFIQTLKTTMNNPRIFFSPRLVNVQALALLSHIAEQYSPPGFSEVIFAQACLLARTMGLHQCRATSNCAAPEETVEKQKVFRSLYIRDKNMSICRGSCSWLPAFDSNIPAFLGQADGEGAIEYGPRIELARIQDEIYRSLHSAEAPSLLTPKYAQLLAGLEQKLEYWAATHEVFKKATSSAEWVTLTLSFLATRISICRGSDDPRMSLLAFSDARASCLLFLLATTTKPNPRFIEALDQILGRNPVPGAASRSRLLDGDGNEMVTSSPRLLADFPLAAIFQVAKNVTLRPVTATDALDNSLKEEIHLLETMRDHLQSTTDHVHGANLTQKLSRTLDTIVRVIRQKRFPEVANTPSIIFNDLSSIHSSVSSGSQRNISGSRKDDTPDPDAPSALVTPGEPTNTSAMLLPFMQPIDGSHSCSAWQSSVNLGGANGVGLSPWPMSYRQQTDATGRVGKRPRLPSQSDMFNMTTVFAEHFQGPIQKSEDDPLSMLDFFSTNNDIAVFDGDE